MNKDRFINQRATRTGVEHGIKLLVFEELLRTKTISAILSFVYRRFQSVKFTELPCLKEIVNRLEWVKEVAEQKADWLDGCQNQYDGT